MDSFGPTALFMILGARPGSEAEVSAWHAEEHIVERLGLPGFRRGRRAVAEGAAPEERFLVIYEADRPEVFESPEYLARLNDPTPWSREVAQNHVAGLKRTVCNVKAAAGTGVGGWCGVLLTDTDPDIPSTDVAVAAGRRGVVGAYVLQGTSMGQQETAEKTARGGGDDTFAGAILIKGIEEDAVRTAIDDFACHMQVSQ